MEAAEASGEPAASAGAASPDPHPVIELRQYKIVRGKREEFIELFERNFIESQEELGMRLVGQFRDSSDLEVAIFTGTGRAFCAGEDMKESVERGTVGSASAPNDRCRI